MREQPQAGRASDLLEHRRIEIAASTPALVTGLTDRLRRLSRRNSWGNAVGMVTFLPVRTDPHTSGVNRSWGSPHAEDRKPKDEVVRAVKGIRVPDPVTLTQRTPVLSTGSVTGGLPA